MEMNGKRKFSAVEDPENVQNDVIFVAKVEPPEIKRNRLLKVIVGDHAQFSTRGAVQDLLNDPAYFHCDRMDGDSCRILIPQHIDPWATYVVLLAALNPGAPLDCKSTAIGLTREKLQAAAAFLKISGNAIGLQALHVEQIAKAPPTQETAPETSEDDLDIWSFPDKPDSPAPFQKEEKKAKDDEEEEEEYDNEPEEAFLSRVRYIQSEFHRKSQAGELLPSSYARMLCLVRKDYLVVPHEIDVYMAVIKWCQHNAPLRLTKKKLDVLLAEIRWDVNASNLEQLIDSEEGPLREALFNVMETLFPPGPKFTVERRFRERRITDSLFLFYADKNQADLRQYVFETNLDWVFSLPPDVHHYSKYKEMGPAVNDCLLFRVTDGPNLTTWSYSMTTKTARSLFQQQIQSGDNYPLSVMNGHVYAWDFKTKGSKNRSFKFNMKTSISTYDVTRPKYFREQAAFETWSGKFYYCGGVLLKNSDDAVSTVEMYDAEKNKWTKLPNMQQVRRCFAAKVHEGFLYVVGGACNEGAGVIGSCERLNLALPKGGWETIGSLLLPRYGHCLFAASGYLFVCGGLTSQGVTRARNAGVERYNQEGKCWEKAKFALGPITSCAMLSPFYTSTSTFH